MASRSRWRVIPQDGLASKSDIALPLGSEDFSCDLLFVEI